LSRGGWFSTPASPHAPPGYAARVAGGILTPVFTIMSAVWFAVMAIALLAVWWAYPHVQIGGWQHPDWLIAGEVPRWVAIAALIAVYALLALPIGAVRRATLFYANGGRPHGWANLWSGLLWIAVVAVLLLAAWNLMPQLQDAVRNSLYGQRVINI
jgi:tellurite resistance protein TehA-like permease